MLSNSITLNDGTSDHIFDLVSREGMNSVRRETNVASNLGSVLEIKNTVVLNSDAVNRHLLRLAKNEIDANTGDVYPYSVHTVVIRDKRVTDANILLMLAQHAALIGTSATMTDVFVGGN